MIVQAEISLCYYANSLPFPIVDKLWQFPLMDNFSKNINLHYLYCFFNKQLTWLQHSLTNQGKCFFS